MHPWPDIVVGLWLLYAAWEDFRQRVVDLGVPVAIVLTRVAVEGPGFLLPTLAGLIPFYIFLKVLEAYHRLVLWFGLPGPLDPIWYDGDTYLLMSVSVYLGLDSLQALAFLLLSLLSSAIFHVLFESLRGKPVRKALAEPLPLSPGVLIAYAALLPLHLF